MKHILVTGAMGLVGTEAMNFFRQKGEWEAIGVDNQERSRLFDLPTQEIPPDVYSLDITGDEPDNRLEHIFELYKFDAIIHAAAQPSHDWSQKDPIRDFDINARGTLLLLEATRKYCPDAVFVHISTDKVYGENMNVAKHDTPFNETLGLDFAGKRSPFGCSKTAADIYVQEYGNYFGMKTVCFRLGCITGRNHKGAELHGFMSYLVKCIKEKRVYRIFGLDNNAVRDQIHAYDLVTACYEFIKNPKCGAVYNLGGGPDRMASILYAVKLIEKETGEKAIIERVDEPRKGDRMWDVHDVSKFQKDYPEWKYKYSLQDIIKDLCQ